MSDDKIKFGFEGSSFAVAYDGDADGKNSAELKVNLAEVLSELRGSGKAEVQADKVTFELDGSDLILKVDLDGDKEAVLEFKASLLEGLQEAGIL
jgi:hypothetical protein